ncbi:MAG TPA: hypothetical protein VFZ21_05770 [Gemmatimonadaceae bacterium]|nr:hypothetical protein [Gemmatimonadaceae bacterium]
MSFHSHLARMLFVFPFATAFAQDTTQTAPICLAPTRAEMVAGNSETAIAAVREAFASFLTGPSLGARPLNARLASQAREEARLASCRYVLLTTIKHQRKQDNGFLRRAAGGVAEAGAREVLGGARSTEARIAANAATSAAAAVREMTYGFKTKDVLELGYRLESADGTVLLEKSEKRTAKSDGEDVLTPLVERASEAVASVVVKAGK